MLKLATKLVWVLALAVLLSAGLVFAQTDDGNTTTVSNGTTTSVSSTIDGSLDGVDVEEITSMPSRWGLWWTSVKENLSLWTTFDPVKKTEKRLKFAEERMNYAQYIADNASDEKTQARAEKMVEKANAYMEKVEASKDKWLEKAGEGKSKLLDNLAAHQLRKEKILDKIEEKIPEEKLAAWQKLRVNSIENGQRLIKAINNTNISSSTRQHLMDVKDRIEDHLQSVKDYQTEKQLILERIKTGDQEAKDDLKELNNERRQELKSNLQERYQNVKSNLMNRVENGNQAAEKRLQNMEKMEGQVKANVQDRVRMQPHVSSSTAN